MKKLSSIKSNVSKKRLIDSVILPRYFKWVISATKDYGGTIQVSEFSFLYNGTRVSYVGATATDTVNTDNANPMKAINGVVSTDKWYAVAMPVTLFVSFPTGILMNQYQISTANDSEGRDPINWVLYSSTDNVSFVAISTKNNYTLPSTRLTSSELIQIN